MADTTSAAAVVVPFYRQELGADERVSLRHLDHFLGPYDRFLFMPKSLRGGLDGFGSRRFSDRFFESRRGYSALLLSRDFYRSFSEYEYVLVYQLDCLVFSDDLLRWCEKEFDYIGAVHTIGDNAPCAGQGGFSLRRVSSFLDVLNSRIKTVDPAEYWERNWSSRPPIERWRNLPRKYAKHLGSFNGVRWEIKRLNRTYLGWAEDWFWSLEARRYHPEFRIAPIEDGLRFAFDQSPETAFAAAGRGLPFGCPGWTRARAFWEPYLLAAEETRPARSPGLSADAPS